MAGPKTYIERLQGLNFPRDPVSGETFLYLELLKVASGTPSQVINDLIAYATEQGDLEAAHFLTSAKAAGSAVAAAIAGAGGGGDATEVTYTPTTPSDWPSPPSTVQGALDDVAAQKEPSLPTSTSSTYLRGDKTFHPLDTSAVPENGNQYFTQARVRAAVSAVVPLVDTNGAFSIPQANASQDGYLASGDFSTFNAKQPAGSYLTGLGSDVSASGPGVGSATVNSVGGSSAANLHTAELAANAATALNTVNTLMKRDSSGNFAAGTATLSGAILGSLSGVLKASLGTVAGSATTSDLPEGSNLYYSDARVQAAAAAGATARKLYVSKDIGNDANDGSLLRPKKTIQAGINAAQLISDYGNPVVVCVSPATGSGYNEDLTFSQQGVILQAAVSGFLPGAVQVTGSVTVNLTGTAGSGYSAPGNYVWISGFSFTKTGGSCLIFSGTTFQRLFIVNSYVISQSSGSAAVLTNTGTNSGTKATITAYDTWFENNNLANPTILISAGRLFCQGANPNVQNDNASGLSLTMDGAAATGGYCQLGNASIQGGLNISDNTANVLIGLCTLNSGSVTAIATAATNGPGAITIAYTAITTTANPAISGFGNLGLTQGNAWGSTGNVIDANVTQILFQSLPSSSNVTSSGVPNASTAAGAFVTDALNTIEGHVVSTANPHAVTAAQAGAVAASGVAKITVSTTTPVSPAVGDLWVNTT